jgi:hypothetical protein
MPTGTDNTLGRWIKRPLSGLLAVAVAATLATGGAYTSLVQTANAATAGPVYWGAAITGAPYDTTAIDKFEADAG